jgi:2-oxoglutarate dehydrogenase E1 component
MSVSSKNVSSSVLVGGNASFLEALYDVYRRDPEAVPEDYRAFFAALGTPDEGPARAEVEDELRDLARAPAADAPAAAADGGAFVLLVDAYRRVGHRAARLDPLGLAVPETVDELRPEAHGFDPGDRARPVPAGLVAGPPPATLGALLERLEAVYCGKLAAEYMHVASAEERAFFRTRLEESAGDYRLPAAARPRLLRELTAAEGIERYLHTRYVGQKRFSLEGGETLMPMLNEVVRRAGEAGIEEIVIGMAHRGRLNVLVNLLGKSPSELFGEFEGTAAPAPGPHPADGEEGERRTGDVKYHLGFSSDVRLDGRVIHLALAFNPSHLESVDPVVEGSVRARQDRRGEGGRERVLPLLIHGDASLVGQGIVQETLQLSATRGFGTGGTVHIVVNNQIGFTISRPDDARSSRYATDVAKMIDAPVLHVNGDDPEAAVWATRLAFEYRARFGRDVFVDLVCFRRHGHNEADEPAATQPVMYRAVRAHPGVRALYAERLAAEGTVDPKESARLVDAYREGLDRGHVPDDFLLARGERRTDVVEWAPYRGHRWDESVPTAVERARLEALGRRLTAPPEGLRPHPRVARILEERARMYAGEQPLDWGAAETLAYATLLTEGYDVRLSGQDTARGTFFHRHAVVHDAETDAVDVPLARLAPDQGRVTIVDSLLSEAAVVGFEYGYATSSPRALVIWEAQYGDFANNAQVMIDQFVSAGEAKWDRLSGLVFFLPHGQEGAGPEHSSARLERFLQLAAEHNIQVCVPSTPAQMFHMLRRQLLRPYRKPLVVMTPKSLLRHKPSFSPLETLSEGAFATLLDDPAPPAKARRLVLVSGKFYYELAESRGEAPVRLVRLEQLYPFPEKEVRALLARHDAISDVVWCQEEPENQGAWSALRARLERVLAPGQTLTAVARPPSAATASGWHTIFEAEQKELLSRALTLPASSGRRGGPARSSSSRTVQA